MKITIEITKDEKFDRNKMLDMFAEAKAEIIDFILNGTTDALSSLPRVGRDAEEFNLEVLIQIEENRPSLNIA